MGIFKLPHQYSLLTDLGTSWQTNPAMGQLSGEIVAERFDLQQNRALRAVGLFKAHRARLPVSTMLSSRLLQVEANADTHSLAVTILPWIA